MTQEEIVQYNKLCAEFLGYANLTPDDKDFDFYEKLDGVLGKRFEPKSLKFHSDWNWIMVVVEDIENKLNDSFNVDIVNKNQCEIVRNGEEFICGAGFDTINHHKKEAVVEAINQFLIWYEENK